MPTQADDRPNAEPNNRLNRIVIFAAALLVVLAFLLAMPIERDIPQAPPDEHNRAYHPFGFSIIAQQLPGRVQLCGLRKRHVRPAKGLPYNPAGSGMGE